MLKDYFFLIMRLLDLGLKDIWSLVHIYIFSFFMAHFLCQYSEVSSNCFKLTRQVLDYFGCNGFFSIKLVLMPICTT